MYFQIGEEIKACLQFLQSVYSTFGFSFQLNLSTRPEDFLGEQPVWDEAEKVRGTRGTHKNLASLGTFRAVGKYAQCGM